MTQEAPAPVWEGSEGPSPCGGRVAGGRGGSGGALLVVDDVVGGGVLLEVGGGVLVLLLVELLEVDEELLVLLEEVDDVLLLLDDEEEEELVVGGGVLDGVECVVRGAGVWVTCRLTLLGSGSFLTGSPFRAACMKSFQIRAGTSPP